MGGLQDGSVDGTRRDAKLTDNGSTGYPGFHLEVHGQQPTVHSHSQQFCSAVGATYSCLMDIGIYARVCLRGCLSLCVNVLVYCWCGVDVLACVRVHVRACVHVRTCVCVHVCV